jgi:threonyl-tRNA synthetase
MRFVYGVFGMKYKLELSTRPAKALGDQHLWDVAETQLADALNEFVGMFSPSLNSQSTTVL